MRTCDIYDIAPRLQDFLSAFADKNGAIHNVTPLEDEHPTLAPMALGQLLGLEAIGADQKREQQNRHERGNPTAVDDGTTCDDWRGVAILFGLPFGLSLSKPVHPSTGSG